MGPGRRGAWRLLRSRDFGPYFAGNAVSASGTWFQNLAASILVYRLSHSPFLLGVLNFCQFVPVLVLAPWAGALADRADRRRLLLATQLAAAALSAALAALAWSGLAREGVVIGFAAALGVALALAQPAQMALVPSLVPREDVAQAVALNSATFNLARVVGPVSAAPIIAWQGIGVAFAINACTYLALAAALLAVRPAPQRRAARAGLRDALALLRGRPALVLYLLVVASVSAGSDPVNTESPALAHAFDRSSAWAGAIVGAFGAGAVVAAFGFAGRVSGSRMRMAATLGTMALGMAAFAVTPWLPLAFVFLAVAGSGYLVSNTAATTRLQLAVAEHERGRIMALWSIAFLGVRPLSSLVDGAVAGAAGVRAAAVVLALPALAGALAAAASLRR
ncbi:MAG TPA: MFS transporter [Gaiellaceae bacterium]|nr:MFS transporter [Gaiellaceae bacterium]